MVIQAVTMIIYVGYSAMWYSFLRCLIILSIFWQLHKTLSQTFVDKERTIAIFESPHHLMT